MKLKYSVKRLINTGNYENIVIEVGVEKDDVSLGIRDKVMSELIAFVEKEVEKKEEEIREQL